MKNILSNVKKILLNNKSYLMIFIIFLLMFLFGKNFKSDSIDYSRIQDAKLLSDIVEKKYHLDQSQNELRIENIISASPNNGFRLFFDMVTTPDSTIVGETSQVASAEVILASNLGDEKLLTTINLASGKDQNNIENIFWADSHYQDLIIRKKDLTYSGSIVIKNIQLFPLNVRDQSQFASLKSSVIGNSIFSNIVQSNWSENPNKSFSFLWRDQKIGQVFTAQSDVISSVDLNIKFVGVGGSGNYLLELYEYDAQSKNISKRLSYFYFGKSNENTISELASKTEDNVYRLPLAANVTKGRQYVLLLNNKTVTFDWLNTIKIFGQKNSYDGQGVFYDVRNKKYKINGSLNVRIYGAEYNTNQGEKVMTNAILQDIGQSHGLYSYRQNENFSDLLDVFETGSSSQNKVYAYYDNITGSILMDGKNDNYFTYKFDTVYPFRRAYFSLEQPIDGSVNPIIYYSFDNADWQKIEKAEAGNYKEWKPSRVEKAVDGDGKQKTIYLKVTYDKQNYNEQNSSRDKNKSFSIKNLRIMADLIMK